MTLWGIMTIWKMDVLERYSRLRVRKEITKVRVLPVEGRNWHRWFTSPRYMGAWFLE